MLLEHFQDLGTVFFPIWTSQPAKNIYFFSARQIEYAKVSSYNCLISNREGLGTSLQIMGLETNDPHSQKEHTEIHKIPKFGVNQASFD